MNIKATRIVITILIQWLIGCTPNTGRFGLGTPTILSAGQSQKSLDEYSTYMQTRMNAKVKDTEIDDLDPLKTNRISRIEYAQAVKGALSVSPNSTSPVSTSENNSSILPSIDNVSIIESTDKPNGLLMDKISTLEAFAAHKQRINDLKYLYKDNKSELYKIGLTLWIEPERQNYWEYIWRWADLYNGFRNYTKDYHVDIKFRLCEDENCNESLNNIQIVRLEPEHEGDIADNYYASMNQSQFGLAGTWTGISSNIDYAERLRQANVEQRKYPILRGLIETKCNNPGESNSENVRSGKCETDGDFHFIISPRQHVEERSIYIPFFMNPYTNTKRLESVPYHVSAYVLVKNQDNTINSESGIKSDDKGSENSKKKVHLIATACYKEYGNPERACSENYILNETANDTNSKNWMKYVVPINLSNQNQQLNSENAKPMEPEKPLKVTEKTKVVETKKIEKLKLKRGSIITTTTETTKSSK